MLASEIQDKLKNVENFLGVFARDELPTFTQIFPQSLVANTDKQDEIGSHWICIFIDQNGNGEYFDSFGLPPLNFEFINYLENNTTNNFDWNKLTLQCTTCVTCGEYCCAYVLLRSAGISKVDFIKMFTTNQYNNDIIIKNIFNSIKN